MRRFLIMAVLLSITLAAGCRATGESFVRQDYNFGQIDRTAVVAVEGLRSNAARNQVADFFNMQLLGKGYNVIERAQLERVLEEQDFQRGALTPEEDAVVAGRILNIPAVVVVNVPRFDEQIEMTAKMIDVETGSILWLATGEGSTGRTLSTIVGGAAGAAAGAGIGGRDDRVLGGVIGGVLGGVGGRALTPEESRQARRVIERMTESLPAN